MTDELSLAYAQAALDNPGIDNVVPVGEAFMRAVQEGVAMPTAAWINPPPEEKKPTSKPVDRTLN